MKFFSMSAMGLILDCNSGEPELIAALAAVFAPKFGFIFGVLLFVNLMWHASFFMLREFRNFKHQQALDELSMDAFYPFEALRAITLVIGLITAALGFGGIFMLTDAVIIPWLLN